MPRPPLPLAFSEWQAAVHSLNAAARKGFSTRHPQTPVLNESKRERRTNLCTAASRTSESASRMEVPPYTPIHIAQDRK